MASYSSASSTAEFMALKNAKGHLIKSIDATSMSSRLFKAGFISQRQYEECKGEKFEKVEKVVEYLLKAVSIDPRKFYAFLYLLHQSEDFAIAGQLRDELEKVEESTPTYKGVIPKEFEIIHAVPINTIVVIPEEVAENLIGLRAQYASMLLKISRELKKLTKENQEMLIFFLSTLIVGIDSRHDMLKALETLRENTSLFNIYYLKQFSTEFPDEIKQKTERLIDEYEDKCKEFMSNTTLNQFKELFQDAGELSARSKIIITLKLSNQWGGRTLEDLKSLIDHFGFPTRHLHIAKVTEGCIAVHMLCACHVVPELKNAVSAASDKLYENGVLQVSVGEAVVLSLMNTDEASSRASDASKLKGVLVGLNNQKTVLDRVMVLST